MTDLGLVGVAHDHVAAFLLCMSRVSALFLLAPVFSSRVIPVRAKLIIAGVISVALVPIAMDGHTLPVDTAGLAGLMAKELLVGAAFAFSIAIIGAAVQAGAGMLDTMIGFSLGAVFDPVTNQHNAILGQFYSLLAATIFVVVGGVEIMILGLARTYEVVPIDAYPSAATLVSLATSMFSQVFVIAVQLTAPPLLALVVADAAFGLVARAVPQMNVFFVGLPAKIVGGLAAIAASLPFLSGFLGDQLEQVVTAALQGLGGG